MFPEMGVFTYVLQGITSNGCIGKDTINITIADGPYITMPNAFSPNSDGDNDIFRILAAGFKKLNYFKIYDRWGEEVFFTNYFRRGWDGTYKGRDCEMGTYFWIISAIDIDNKEKTIKGDVTLLR